MNPTGIAIVAGVVVLALAFGLWRRAHDGKVNAVATSATHRVPGLTPGARAVILQFSSEFCAPCRRVRAVIAEEVSERGDVDHVDLDVAEHPDLARSFDVLRTPTVVILDGAGAARFRSAGGLRPREFASALAQVAPIGEAA